MIITSKFKAYGIFALTLSGLLFVGIWFFIYLLVSVVFLGGHIIPRGSLPPFGAIIFIAVSFFLLGAIFKSWTNYVYYIEIDNENKTILFRNIITQQKNIYSFNDFDSYFDTYPVTGK